MKLIGRKGIPTDVFEGNPAISNDKLILVDGTFKRGNYSYATEKWFWIEEFKRTITGLEGDGELTWFDMENKNFTLTYDELLLLLKEAYRTGYATYEMTAAGLERYDDDGYARWVLLGMEKNKLQMEVNASETQKYYKSKEVQDLDNPTDVVDEYPITLPLKRNGKVVGEITEWGWGYNFSGQPVE